MKRLIFTLLVCALMATPALAGPSLGSWNEDDPRTTHIVFDFTPGYVGESGVNTYNAAPEENNSPFSGVGASITASNPSVENPPAGGSWDGQTAFVSDIPIVVNMEIPNYENLSGYKIVWVEVISNTAPINLGASATDGTFVDFEYILLDGQGDADFGWKIIPNPRIEKIWFTIPLGDYLIDDSSGASGQITVQKAYLDLIHVDTICIPAPGAIILGSLGVGLVGWLRRRRTL